MQSPSLFGLKPFSDPRDITLYMSVGTNLGVRISQTEFHASSFDGHRSTAEFFYILDHFVKVDANDHRLQPIENYLRLARPPVERTSGNIAAGDYLIEPVVEGGQVYLKGVPPAFFKTSSKKTGPTVAKRVKRDRGDSSECHESIGSEGSERLNRDPSGHNQGFKMRLVYRDKGCVVCLATGSQDLYKYSDDSNRFDGAHIIPVAQCELWDTHGYSAMVNDPFTDPENANNAFASPSTQTKTDTRRINSLENGMLLCTQHHGDYDHFRISIHPMTHEIFSFHPATHMLQGIEVKAPWDRQDPLFPPPHDEFLNMHYSTSITKAMKCNGDDYELNDDDEDYEELSEPEEAPIEKVEIWLHDLVPGRDVTSSLDFMAESKGNIENMLGQGVPGVVTGRV